MSQITSLGSGGGGGAIITINGDTGSAVGPVVDLLGLTAGGSLSFDASGSTINLSASDSDLNTFVGNSTPGPNTGIQNTAVGYSALTQAGPSAGYNVAIGNHSLDGLVAARFNVGVGRYSFGGTLGDIGDNNTGVGFFAGQGVMGSDNTAIGYASMGVNGPALTCSNNICIGSLAGSSFASNESSNILIGNIGVAAESNVMRLGTTGAGAGQQNKTYIAGVDGVNVGSVASVVTMNAGQLGTATITAGTNISVTPGANTVTIAGTGAASFTWSKITANQAFTVNNGFICNKAGLLTLTLPTTTAVGDIFEVTGINTDVGWRIAQNANQIIHFGNAVTTTGAAGYIESTEKHDSVRMVTVVADLEFNVISAVGNPTIF